MNEVLENYTANARKAGQNNEQIKLSLLSSGWKEEDIAFTQKSPEKKSNKKKIIKYLFGGIVGGFLIGYVLLEYVTPFTLSLVYGGDIPPQDDSDLIVAAVNISPEENFYFDFLEIKKLSDIEPEFEATDPYWYFSSSRFIEEEGSLSKTSWDNELAKHILERESSARALEIFEGVVDKKRFQAPRLSSPDEISSAFEDSIFSTTRSVIRLGIFKSEFLKRNQMHEEAIKEALKVINLGRKLEDSNIDILHLLVAEGAISNGLQQFQDILNDKSFSEEKLEEYNKQIEKLYTRRPKLEDVIRVEYLQIKNNLENTINETVKKEYGPNATFETIYKSRYKYILKPNATNLFFINWARVTINNWRKPCGSEYDKIEEITLPGNAFKLVFIDNGLGKLISSVFYVDYSEINDRLCEVDYLIEDILK